MKHSGIDFRYTMTFSQCVHGMYDKKILCDDYKSILEATQFLFQSGAQNVLYLYNSQSYSGLKKLSGYQSAVLQSGHDFRPEYIRLYQGEREDIEAITDFLVQLNADGLDFAVIGYNNSLLTSCCEPPLTSVDSKLNTLCAQLAKTQMGVLTGTDMPQKIIFSGELIKRGTTRS